MGESAPGAPGRVFISYDERTPALELSASRFESDTNRLLYWPVVDVGRSRSHGSLPLPGRITSPGVNALPEVDMARARSAVAAAGARVASLVRSIEHSTAPALGDWDLTDVAVHLSHVLDAVTALARGGGPLLGEIGELTGLSQMLVRGENERDLRAIADRIEASVANFLEVTAAEGSGTREWLTPGTRMPMSGLVCHVLNELTVHGRDMALADGKPWPIERSPAALVVCGFLFPALGNLGSAMVNQAAAAGVRVSFDVRVRGGSGAVFTFADGELSLRAASSGPVDCHLSVDPAAFLLVAWGRQSHWGPIARGQLLTWGRRPWMGLKLRTLMLNP